MPRESIEEKKEEENVTEGLSRSSQRYTRMVRGHQHRNTIVFLTSLTAHARWLG